MPFKRTPYVWRTKRLEATLDQFASSFTVECDFRLFDPITERTTFPSLFYVLDGRNQFSLNKPRRGREKKTMKMLSRKISSGWSNNNVLDATTKSIHLRLSHTNATAMRTPFRFTGFKRHVFSAAQMVHNATRYGVEYEKWRILCIYFTYTRKPSRMHGCYALSLARAPFTPTILLLAISLFLCWPPAFHVNLYKIVSENETGSRMGPNLPTIRL